MEIRDKIIVLTGATEGIGLATAKLLSERGARLALAARSADKLEALARELPNSLAVPTDMRDPAAPAKLLQAARERFGRVDILVNNAGQGGRGPLESINIEDYQQLIELNVYGPLRAMQAAIPIMREQGGGMIVNISSNVSKNVYPGLAMYASTKYALNCLSLTARAELERDGITVSLVHPGLTATGFGKNAITNDPSHPIPGGMTAPDAPEQVAEKIIEAIGSGAAETAMR